MWETERFDVAERVADSKARLSEKLSELSKRVDSVRDAARPAQIVKRPWFPFVAAGIVGLLIGARRPRPRAPAGRSELPMARPPSLGSALAREVLLSAAGAYTRRYFSRMPDDER
jgi:hypothetical protein